MLPLQHLPVSSTWCVLNTPLSAPCVNLALNRAICTSTKTLTTMKLTPRYLLLNNRSYCLYWSYTTWGHGIYRQWNGHHQLPELPFLWLLVLVVRVTSTHLVWNPRATRCHYLQPRGQCLGPIDLPYVLCLVSSDLHLLFPLPLHQPLGRHSLILCL